MTYWLCLAIYQVAWVQHYYPHASKRYQKAAFNLCPSPVMYWYDRGV